MNKTKKIQKPSKKVKKVIKKNIFLITGNVIFKIKHKKTNPNIKISKINSKSSNKFFQKQTSILSLKMLIVNFLFKNEKQT